MAKKNIEPFDICMLMMFGSITAISGATAYAIVKDASRSYTVSTCYSTKPKEDEDAISSEYRDAVGFFDDFVDDYV